MKRKSSSSDDLSMVRAIGIEPTTPTVSRRRSAFSPNSADLFRGVEMIEIPSDFQIVPAVEYRDGKMRMYRVLIKTAAGHRDFSVTSRRTKKVR
jgi:hypothetical protein